MEPQAHASPVPTPKGTANASGTPAREPNANAMPDRMLQGPATAIAAVPETFTPNALAAHHASARKNDAVNDAFAKYSTT